MPRYTYIAIDALGQEVVGAISATDAAAAESALVDKGLFSKELREDFDLLTRTWLRHTLKSEITRVTRQIHLLIQSRLTVPEVLDLVSEQTNHTALRRILQSIQTDVESGRSLAESFGRFPFAFDEMYLSLLEVGEMAGKLDTTIDQIAKYREAREEAVKKLQSALSYPVLVLGVAAAVVAVLVLHVVPIFAGMYANFNAELPVLTQTVVGLSEAIRSWSWWLLLSGVILATGAAAAFSSNRIRHIVDRLLLTVPVISRLTRKLVAARLCQTLGTLLTSGVTLVDAMAIAARTTGNRHLRESMHDTQLQVITGKSLTDVMSATGLYPRALLRLIAAGERTGELGAMIQRAATYFEQDTQNQLKTLTSLIEPVTIVILGVVVAVILVAMYLPMFELVNVL